MKKTIKAFFIAMTLFTGGIMTSSCDPCSGVVCNNGNCSNGTCICDQGYKRSGNGCIPVNSSYTSADWSGTQIYFNHFFGLQPDTQSVTYTIEPSDIVPNQVVLKSFLGYLQNDLPFSINLDTWNTVVEELVLPVDITNGTLTNPPFLPVPYNVAGTINSNELEISLTTTDSVETYKLILQKQ